MIPQDAQLDDEQIILLGTSERHLRQARAKRRRRAYVVAIVTLGVATTTLAAVNLTLARRGAAPAVAESPKPVVPIVASKPVVEVVTPPAAAKPVEPAVVAKPVERPVTPPVAAKPTPAPVVAAKPPVVTVPARTVVAKQPAAKTPDPVAASPAPAVRKPTAGRVVETAVIEKSTEATHFGETGAGRDRTIEPQAKDSGSRVARWMITTYGKADAERRAEVAATLYPAGDDRTEHWQKVLGHVRATN